MMALDIAVGAAFLLAAPPFRRRPQLAALVAATGLLWFAGDVVPVLVFAHRAPLTHVLLLYPDTRLRSWPRRCVVVAAYVVCFVYPIGHLGWVTAAIFAAVAIAAPITRAQSVNVRSARIAGTGCALVWGVLTAAALTRQAGAHVDQAFLTAYEFVLIAVLLAIAIDNRYRRWRTAIVTNLAVDLGDSGARTLRDVLAEVLGDPGIVVGLVTPDGLTDEGGHTVMLRTTPEKVITELVEDDRRIALLQHDAGLLRDQRLLDSVAALAAVALANTRLQEDVRARIAEVEASRRRLVAVADDQRDRLEAVLQSGVMTRLERVEDLLTRFGSADLCEQIDSTRETIRAFARGVYPRRLEQAGLAALQDISHIADGVQVTVPDERFAPDVEAAAYFVCVEALTNVARYARASATQVSIHRVGSQLSVEIADNGVGGADPANGTGLLGLRDRLDVLGGTFTVDSSTLGTRVSGLIPLMSRVGGHL